MIPIGYDKNCALYTIILWLKNAFISAHALLSYENLLVFVRTSERGGGQKFNLRLEPIKYKFFRSFSVMHGFVPSVRVSIGYFSNE